MIKKLGIIGKIFNSKKKESNCCSFEIEEVDENNVEKNDENKCCSGLKEEKKCCTK